MTVMSREVETWKDLCYPMEQLQGGISWKYLRMGRCIHRRRHCEGTKRLGVSSCSKCILAKEERWIKRTGIGQVEVRDVSMSAMRPPCTQSIGEAGSGKL